MVKKQGETLGEVFDGGLIFTDADHNLVQISCIDDYVDITPLDAGYFRLDHDMARGLVNHLTAWLETGSPEVAEEPEVVERELDFVGLAMQHTAIGDRVGLSPETRQTQALEAIAFALTAIAKALADVTGGDPYSFVNVQTLG